MLDLTLQVAVAVVMTALAVLAGFVRATAKWQKCAFLVLGAVGVVLVGCQVYRAQTLQPEVQLYFDDGEFEGQKIQGQEVHVQLQKIGDLFVFTLGPFDLKETGARAAAPHTIIRVMLKERDMFSVSGGLFIEPGYSEIYGTVLRSNGWLINAGDQSHVYQFQVAAKKMPPPRIPALLQVHFGPAKPAVGPFTIVVDCIPAASS